MEILSALAAWFTTNLPQIETLAQRIAADVTAVYVLALSLAAVLAPFFNKANTTKQKLLSVLNLDQPLD
jgi:hypothetical protein